MTRNIRKVLMSVALWAAFVGAALGETEIVDGIRWKYTIYNGEASVGTGSSSDGAVPIKTSGELVIPSKLGGCPVTGIEEFAFLCCSGLKSVTIPEGVTSIGKYAFETCSGLESVMIPPSVTSIGYRAFYGCSGLTRVDIADLTKWCEIDFGVGHGFDDANPLSRAHHLYLKGEEVKNLTIPEGLTRIEIGAFCGCSGLESVKIPSSVTIIGDSAFKGCSGLKRVDIDDLAQWRSIKFGYVSGYGYVNSDPLYANPLSYAGHLYLKGTEVREITIPSGVTSVEECAYYGWSGLTSVTIPSSVTSIGKQAFYGCSGLKSVTIPSSVTSIGQQAFYGCSGLKSVTIPPSVTSIGERAFNGCNGLADAEGLVVVEGVLHGYCGSAASVTIPEGVISIGEYAFYDCSGLKSVTIPSSVTNIGDRAFCGCSGLTSVTIPSSVTSIGKLAFYGCSRLTSVVIPSSVTSIGSYAFDGCSGLKSVTIPSCVTSLSSTFPSAYESIKEVTLQEGVMSIGETAFYGCEGLESVTIPSSVTSIGEGAFSGCSGLTSMTLPFIGSQRGNSGCKEALFGYIFGTSAYMGTTATRQWYYSSYVTYFIPSSLKSVIITDETKIGYGAFYCCGGLESITIPSSVTSIADYAFAGCSGLKSVTIPSGVTSIGKAAFDACEGLKSVTIPPGVTSIGDLAFYGCSGLKSVMIPEGVTSIGEKAFYACCELTSVTIPESVASIGSSAFYGCSGLESVTIPSSVTSIGDYAFKGCYLETVYVDTGNVEDARQLLENSNSELNFEDVSFVEVDVKEIVAGSKVVVTFKSYDGRIETLVRNRNEPIGPLPSPPPLTGCSFDGWFTAEAGGSRISETTIADGSVRFYAHWSMMDCGTISSEGVQLWEGGPYWAEQNLGASRPEEYGYYFKWADAVGYSYEGGEIKVSGTDYSVGMRLSGYWVSSEGVRMSSSPFTRSNSLDSKSAAQLESGGYVSVEDGKITDAHDAARVQWGAPWRIPTKEENEELLDKCTLATVSRNGVFGRLVVGRGNYAAKSIFIPFAGYVDGSSAFAVGALSVRWASTFRVDGYTWYHCNYWHNIDDYERWWRKHGEVAGQVWQGSSIRAVRDAGSGSTAAVRFTVSFSANGGEMNPETREVTMGQPLGELPTPTRTGCVFAGWFTEPNAGREVTAQTVVTGNVTYYAHWKYAAPGQETGAGLTFTTGGSADWIVAETSHDGNGAARSGSISNSQSSWLQTTVVGPCRLSFWWKVSSESGYDKLHWYLDGVEQGDPISGEKGWARVTTELPAGNHVVKWSYTKDGSTSNGQDCAWVDQVEVESLSFVAMFDANGGTPSSSRTVNAGNPLGALPTATRAGYEFLGWFTEEVGGSRVTAATVVTADVTFYAHWRRLSVDDGDCKWYYAVWGDGAIITGVESASGAIMIPSTLGVYPVTSIGYAAFANCSGLMSVTIPSSVTSIGSRAFRNCRGLTSVTIPSSVKHIEYGAFSGCTGLTSVTMSEGVTSIEGDVFAGCTGLMSVTIPESVTWIGEGAFSGCEKLLSVTIRSKVARIELDAFRGTSFWDNLWKESQEGLVIHDGVVFGIKGNVPSIVELPAGTRIIAPKAFENCGTLTAITMPEGVASIGDCAFAGCRSLKTFNLPETVSAIGWHAFEDCDIDGDGVLIVDGCVLCVKGDCPTNVVIPDGVRLIADGALEDQNIKTLKLPKSLKNVGVWAFGGVEADVLEIEDVDAWYSVDCEISPNEDIPWCSFAAIKIDGQEVRDLVIPTWVTAIKPRVFFGWRGIDTVAIHSGVTSIGAEAFLCCEGLASVTIPPSVTSIGDYAFAFCSGLKSVTIPSSVTSIGACPFEWCESLKTIYVSGDGDIECLKQKLSDGGFDVNGVTFVRVGCCKVKFDLQGGVAERTEMAVSEGMAVGDLPTATREGYEFLGWFTAAVGGTQVTAATVVTGDVTFYAHWRAHTYTVRFEANGGSGTMADQVFTYDMAQNLRANAFVRSGYYFGGWSLTEDGTVNYGDCASVINLSAEAAGRVVLYACWVENGAPPPPIKPPVGPSAGEVPWPEDVDFSAAAANVYDGYVIDDECNLLGVVQVKTAKQSVKTTTDKKTKVKTVMTNITATATVTDANGKKWSYSKGVVTVDGAVTGLKCTTKGCPVGEFGVKVGKNGLEGVWGEYAIFGARNGMGMKGDAMMVALEAYKGKWSVTLSCASLTSGQETASPLVVRLQFDVQAKGVVKIAGNWENGAKVSASAQMVMGDGFAYVPVMVKATKTSPALNALLRIDANAAATGMSPPQAVTLLSEGELVAGGRTAEELGEPDYLPSEVSAGGKAFLARVAVNELAYPAKFAAKKLPTGLKIDAATGIISGTPTKPGHYVAEVTVTSGLNSKVKKTLTVEFDIANYTDDLIPIEDSYGPYYVGVSAAEQIAAAAGCTASGLPSGLKWTAKDIVDTKTKAVKTAANTVYGIPTKACTNTVYFKKTVKETVDGKTKSVTHQASATFIVEGMKPWAYGTFNGGNTNGIVTLTVSNVGKISGKWMSEGLTWTLSAASYAAYYPDEEKYVATVQAKCGKKTKTIEVEVTQGGVIGLSAPVADDRDGTVLFEAWRNGWKEEPQKTLATKLKGQKVTVGENGNIVLTVGAGGAVAAKGTFGSYSASCSTVLIPTAEAGLYRAYLYFPPKSGKFDGFADVVEVGLGDD